MRSLLRAVDKIADTRGRQIHHDHAGIIREVQEALAANDVVVVGMKQNPFPKKARRALDAAGLPYIV